MDSPVPVRPAGNGPEGETGTTVRYQKTGGFLKPEGALIPPPKDAVQHRMGVEVHLYGGPPEASTRIKIVTTDNVTGEEASWCSPETCSRGGCVDATYNVDSFDYSIFEREHTLNAYSDDGNLIGTWTGIFTKDFFSDET